MKIKYSAKKSHWKISEAVKSHWKINYSPLKFPEILKRKVSTISKLTPRVPSDFFGTIIESAFQIVLINIWIKCMYLE